MQSVTSCGLRSDDIHNLHEAMISRLSDSSLQRWNSPLLTVLAVKIIALLPNHDLQDHDPALQQLVSRLQLGIPSWDVELSHRLLACHIAAPQQAIMTPSSANTFKRLQLEAFTCAHMQAQNNEYGMRFTDLTVAFCR